MIYNITGKLTGLARVCAHLALDAERSGREGAGYSAAYWRGKAAGYISACRQLRGIIKGGGNIESR